MAMGNTEAAWDTFYDRMYQRREMEAGIDAMGPWRQSMLEKAMEKAIIVKPEPTLSRLVNLEQDEIVVLDSDSDDDLFQDCEM